VKVKVTGERVVNVPVGVRVLVTEPVRVRVTEVDALSEQLWTESVRLTLELTVILRVVLGVQEGVPVPVGETSFEKEGEGVQETDLLGLRVKE